MKKIIIYNLLVIALSWVTVAVVQAGPVRISDVTPVVNGNPAKSAAPQLLVKTSDDPKAVVKQNGGDDTKKTTAAPQQQENPRVIVEDGEPVITQEAEPCNCPADFGTGPFNATKSGFPYKYLLPLAATPLVALCCTNGGSTPTPTPIIVPPNDTPTPTTPTPEPATILLFGTGLSGIGFAARRWLRKSNENLEQAEKV